MDADDISRSTRLAQQINSLQGHSDIGICHSLVELIDADGAKIPLRGKVGFRYTPDQTKWALIWRNCIIHPTVMIRGELLRSLEICYDPLAIGCEDYKLWCRLKEKTLAALIPQPLLKYRKHTGSVTSNYDEKLLNSYMAIVSNNLMKIEGGIRLTQDELRTLAIISGQTKLRGQKLDYTVDPHFYIKLVKHVRAIFLEQYNGDQRTAAEINRAIAYQFLRWSRQTLFKERSAAAAFLAAAIISVVKSRRVFSQ